MCMHVWGRLMDAESRLLQQADSVMKVSAVFKVDDNIVALLADGNADAVQVAIDGYDVGCFSRGLE